MILCSPHNPATTIIRRGPLTKFLEALGNDPPLVVLDEAYCDFCDDPEYPDGIALLALTRACSSLRTFSKIAALAGLRVGYAVGRPESIDRLNRVAGTLQREPARPGRGPGRARRPRAPRADPPAGAGGARVPGRRSWPARVHLPALAGQLLPGQGRRGHALRGRSSGPASWCATAPRSASPITCASRSGPRSERAAAGGVGPLWQVGRSGVGQRAFFFSCGGPEMAPALPHWRTTVLFRALAAVRRGA